MRNPVDYLSRSARTLRGSAIRKATDLESTVPDLISLAAGFPDPKAFPWDELREIAQSILSGSDPTVLQYGLTRGYHPLIEAVAEVLRGRGIQASTAEIIVTTGSQQALDLCARVFVDPGDTILVELPTYTGAITAFTNQRARLVGVQQDGDGIDLADLDRVLVRERAGGHRVALVYVVPNFQNPTGLLMSRERRASLLEWARRRDIPLVEDDPYGVLYFEDLTTSEETRPIKADDDEGRVIYLSTFSKTAAPGFRVAWIAAPAPVVERVEVAKQSADLCSGSLDQRLAFELWKRGIIDRRLPTLRETYQRKRQAIEAALRREMSDLVTWSTPKGGFFVWAEFRQGVNTDLLLQRAIRHGVLYVPGSAFDVEQQPGAHARLSFSAHSQERIDTGVERLAAAVREEMASMTAAGPSAVEPGASFQAEASEQSEQSAPQEAGGQTESGEHPEASDRSVPARAVPARARG